VLVIDSDEQVQSLMKSALEREHYRVVPADSVFGALHTIRTRPPDLVILSTDFLIPQGGWALSEQIWHIQADLPIIFMAGPDETPPEIPMRGPHRITSRPVHVRELTPLIKELLGRTDN